MVLVASRSGVIEGFAIMKFGDNTAHLLLLAVLPQARRSGIGSSLLRWLEKSCVTAGILHVRLEMRAANRAANLFYRKLGYRRLCQVAAYYDRREAAVVMGRTLNERVSG